MSRLCKGRCRFGRRGGRVAKEEEKWEREMREALEE